MFGDRAPCHLWSPIDLFGGARIFSILVCKEIYEASGSVSGRRVFVLRVMDFSWL